ncbi:phage Gp37/Gp68 family protein [Mesorhizobium sp. B1-1-7]|uniref:phage Gp37/Gp68 family protein n=1 Tax=Mesorhizobium sp. B1-1-7 TaxID=2589977 RepID=UPI00112987BD|nr:phage Gp37/Gp68 family protein [Mesorhizobium sp. B1-1-7]TPN43238.1 phage Gp37/Gp68 family protein [Mesorhizobium sp. B1-1-7]
MADKSAIEWTDATWNPIVGCSILTPGCTHCYAMGMAGRIEAMTAALKAQGKLGAPHYDGTTKKVNGNTVWTGKLALAPAAILTEPLAWRRPRRIFVNSMGDLFHEDVPDAWIDEVFAVMAVTPHHSYQPLTKRATRARRYLSDPATKRRIYSIACDLVIKRELQVILIAPGMDQRDAPPGPRIYLDQWPLPNVWLGVSAERQQEADERIPELLATPAAIRFVSAEPLLGPIDFYKTSGSMPAETHPWRNGPILQGIDWIIVGGESGPDARPMHPDWARAIRDQCAAAGVPFFFKQWGEWVPGECANKAATRTERTASLCDDDWLRPKWSYSTITPRQSEETHRDDEPDVYRLGKKAAGRKLDGVEHNAMPEAR